MSEFYAPVYGRGVRWDDPVFGIQWPPAERIIISERDRSYQDFHLLKNVGLNEKMEIGNCESHSPQTGSRLGYLEPRNVSNYI